MDQYCCRRGQTISTIQTIRGKSMCIQTRDWPGLKIGGPVQHEWKRQSPHQIESCFSLIPQSQRPGAYRIGDENSFVYHTS